MSATASYGKQFSFHLLSLLLNDRACRFDCVRNEWNYCPAFNFVENPHSQDPTSNESDEIEGSQPLEHGQASDPCLALEDGELPPDPNSFVETWPNDDDFLWKWWGLRVSVRKLEHRSHFSLFSSL